MARDSCGGWEVSENERKVLGALLEGEGYGGFSAFGFRSLVSMTGLERKVVRRACRSLARKGLAEFHKGLWTEDGEPAGSGYSATKKSLEAA